MPRERLIRHGASTLTDPELLSVILGSGIRGLPVQKLALDLLRTLDEKDGFPTTEDLLRIRGLGPAGGARLSAAFEFVRRRLKPVEGSIKCPEDVHRLVSHYGDRNQEHFLSLSLNGAGEPIHARVVSVGLVNRTQVHPREVFAGPITDRAASLIVAHNHPSGSTSPSPEDINVTRRLREAGDILGVELLDHLIFTRIRYTSLRDEYPDIFIE